MSTKRSIFVSLAVIGIVAAMITAATSAVFTDSATSAGNTFSAGTLDIKLTDDNEAASDAATASISFEGVAPGDSVVKPVTVSNDGSLALRYALSSSSTNIGDPFPLAGQIDLEVVAVAGAGACTASAFSGTPTFLYNGVLSAAGFGDVTPGLQAGDRPLAASATEVLCLKAELPLSTGDDFQGASTTTTFTFTAEQTANN